MPVNIDVIMQRLVGTLRTHATGQGPWEGRLSASALSTAVAAFALHRLAPAANQHLVARALHWIADHANPDGAWGDTPHSRGNLSTTLLCRAALTACGAERHAAVIARCNAWISGHTGAASPAETAAVVLKSYGNDRTFSTPILAMCAMAGCLGPPRDAWRHIPQLPLELAVLPDCCYRWMRLPMVSYALPALIAIGLVRHRRRPSSLPGIARLRDRLTPRLLDELARRQPADGGFLAAAPLTGFVAMSLCAAGLADHPVAQKAGRFLVRTMRDDGSWPIDANLKTWLTTQAVCALAEDTGAQLSDVLGATKVAAIRTWLLSVQCSRRHPYTGAAPGGWAWTDLPGGVPDADDTAGALAALRRLAGTAGPDPGAKLAAASGIRWLLDMQNRDGGMPTFCRGWNRLPFDRGCPDITAHALHAMLEWRDDLPPALQTEITGAVRRALAYLERVRNRDGSWTPLWFGHQDAPGQQNRVYGTSVVLSALAAHGHRAGNGPADQLAVRAARLADQAMQWLIDNRNPDGGWGAQRGIGASIEETALAVRALAKHPATPETILWQGLEWIEQHLAPGAPVTPAPIGLYFARLWYGEELYPLIWTLAACGALKSRRTQDRQR